MKWVADENIDRQIVEALRADDHQVFYVLETAPTAADEDVLAMASDESALLLTADKDFGELVYRQGRASAGVVVFGNAPGGAGPTGARGNTPGFRRGKRRPS